jgi:Dock homology region 2
MSLCSGRLVEIMRHQAALLEHIITSQRYYPEYFRVAFYGNFPVAIRNKQFIVCPNSSCSCIYTKLSCSIAVMSGKGSGHFVIACALSMPARRY